VRVAVATRYASVPGASLGGEGLAEICFEIKCRTAPPGPDGGKLRGTCGSGRSGTVTRWPRRCGGCENAS
jgi:hypothetical protein